MIVKFDDFEIDDERFELRQAGARRAVQPKVLDLILLLARNRHRVLTKDEILERLWGGASVTEASINQAVSLARKLLDDPPRAERRIRTVRGRGFQFVAQVTVHDEGAALSDSGATGTTARHSHLFVTLHAGDPTLGSARHDLEGVDEIDIGRGAAGGGRRQGRRLVIRIGDEAVAPDQGRLLRTEQGFVLLDFTSRSGTFVNGQRISHRLLADGDCVHCGRTFFLLRYNVPTPAELPRDMSSDELGDELGSLIPENHRGSTVIDRLARSALPILITGEPGGGQDRAARAIHRRSGRGGPLVVVGGGALAAETAVRQLFGLHRGGDGREPSAGLVRRAERGTLVVEQIDALPPEGQAALMHLLEMGSVLPVGADQPVAVDARLVATTTVDLRARVAAGRFREDLYALLSGFRYAAPPLRTRRAELGFLTGRLLSDHGEPIRLTAPAASRLIAHNWPGNLRELQQALHGALALAGGQEMTADHFPTLPVVDPARAAHCSQRTERV